MDLVKINGKTLHPGQGNNMYIFPGVGLGSIIGELSSIPEEVFYSAAKILSECVTEEDIKLGRVYPPLSEIRDISLKIAVKICNSFSEKFHNMNVDKICENVKNKMYYPQYNDIIS